MSYSGEIAMTGRRTRRQRDLARERAPVRQVAAFPEFVLGQRQASCNILWGPGFNVASQSSSDDQPFVDSSVFKSTIKSPQPRPMDLADKFRIVEGVPTFTWADPAYWSSFHLFSLSFDKTRLALVEKETKICVYDILDNFALIAESEESFDRVNCIAFPRTQNDAIIAVHENSTISLLSICMDNSEHERSHSKSLPQKLCVKVQHQIFSQGDSSETVFFLIAHQVCESSVFFYDLNLPNEFTLCSTSEGGYSEIKIHTQGRMRPGATFISVPHEALIVVVESETNNEKKKTWIWKGIDFKEEVIQRRPIEIEGQCMGFSDCGRFFLVWKSQQRAQDVLGFYNIDTLDTDVTCPMLSRHLPADILDVKVKFFDRESIEFRDVDLRCDKYSPIVAFLTTHKNKVSLSFWDPHTNEILKRINFQTSSMVWSPDAELQFCFSPNLKWIVLEGWLNGRISLFSLESTRLVWDADLIDEGLARAPYSAFEFDASSTKLIVNSSKNLYAFAPPCLIEGYRIQLRCTEYELCVNTFSLLAPLTLNHRRLLSKEFLKRLILGQLRLRAKQYMNYFDAAVSRTSSTAAMLVWKKNPPLLLLGPMNNFSSAVLKYYFQDENASGIRLQNVRATDVSQIFAGMNIAGWNPSVSLFLYPDRESNEDLIVIFASTTRFWAAFKDPLSRETEYIHFSTERCAQVRQSNDGSHVTCVMRYGVMIIDLTSREQTQFVKYEAVGCWRHYLHDSRALERASIDHEGTIVIGFDKDRKCVVYLTPDLRDEDVLSEVGLFESIMPCCTLRRDHALVGYFEFNGLEKSPTALVITNYTSVTAENNHRRVLKKEEWNLHTRRVVNALFNNVVDYTLHFDEKTGHLWIIGIIEKESKSNVVFVPFGPFSLDNCVPCLYMEDYPANTVTATEIERMLHTFRDSFLTMPFNRRSNCDIVLDTEDMSMAWKFSYLARNSGILLSAEWNDFIPDGQYDDLLELAVAVNDYALVKECLAVTTKKMPDSCSATTVKKCFGKLYTNFQSLLIPIIEDDRLLTEICDVEVYTNVLYTNDHLQVRVGTCESLEDWMDASYDGKSFFYWRSINEHHAINIARHGNSTRAEAKLMVFFIDDVCKVGLNGIIRFLLMHNAPSHIFKSSLIKWIIIFKWEQIWKRRSIGNCMFYLCYIGTFSAYTICIGFFHRSLENIEVSWAYLSTLLFTTLLMASFMAYKEVVQLMTCCSDAKELFSSYLYGAQSYLSSPWNLLEVLSYSLLFAVLCLHVSCLYNTPSTLPLLYVCSAVENLLMWIKIWYYAQPFSRTGALVLLVENVVRDCVPFLVLVLAVLVGFAFTMSALFQNVLYKMKFEEESETKIAIDQGFGNPIKSMLTLFYAMVGIFDPMFFLDCGLWSISTILIFVSYLSIQMILMLNMLIALMGDTFDRVKNTEEEQLLLGRARFVDACEAQLTRKQILNIEKNVKKYLYVIFPKDRTESEVLKLWQGRVTTIEKEVERMVENAQRAVISELKKEIEDLRREIRMLTNSNEGQQ